MCCTHLPSTREMGSSSASFAYLGLAILALVAASAAFEYADRLGTNTPYRQFSTDIPTPASPPDGCKRVFTNFLGRYERENIYYKTNRARIVSANFLRPFLSTLSAQPLTIFSLFFSLDMELVTLLMAEFNPLTRYKRL